MKRFDLMHGINTRGAYLASQQCIPHLKRAANPHILNLSPPLSLDPKWFAPHVAYTMAKFGMSLCVLGMHQEFRADRIAVNALWPRTAIDTEAIRLIMGPELRRRCRLPTIVADAAHVILTKPSTEFTGRFSVDEDVLREAGITDFSRYRHPGVREEELVTDFFVE
jgi:citronellol/citronellal dehydrogenase